MIQHLDHVTLQLFIRICEVSTIACAKERGFIAPSAGNRVFDIEIQYAVAQTQ